MPLALLALALVATVGALAYRRHAAVRSLRIATGLRGGTFLPLGTELAAVFQRDVPRVRARALESSGGEASVRMLQRHEVDFALVSNNTRGDDSIQLVAPLYEETLQIVVRRDAHITSPLDLRGKRASVGASGSGTEAIAWQVIRQFGLREADLTTRNLTLLDARLALEELMAGELEANQLFTTLQDYLSAQVAEADRALTAKA